MQRAPVNPRSEGRVVAFVPVRLTSTRLARKHLREIGDRSLISWAVKRLRDCRSVHDIVICAPDEPSSNDLRSVVAQEGVELFFYSGDVNDVVGRLTAAALRYGADICILASGDCPLLNPATIDKLVASLASDTGDVAYVHPRDGQPPIHEGVVIAKRWVWERAERLSDSPELREHQFPVLQIKSECFRDARRVGVEDDLIYYRLQHRISVDTPADVDFMNATYDRLLRAGRPFDLANVIELLLEQPELQCLNRDVHQKALTERSFRAVFVVTAVDRFGYGNLLRAIELATILTNIHGVGVSFVVLDAAAKEVVEARGYTAEIQPIEQFGDNAARCDLVVFDINKYYEISASQVEALKNNGTVIVFIDNILASTNMADAVFIPHAHYAGPTGPNLYHGPIYAIVRDEVKRLSAKRLPKEDYAIVYMQRHLHKKAQEHCLQIQARHPNITFEWVTKFDDEFLEKLARARFVITTLGLTAYEALCLRAEPHIVQINEDERRDIEQFESYRQNFNVDEIFQGTRNVAGKIMQLIRSSEAEIHGRN